MALYMENSKDISFLTLSGRVCKNRTILSASIPCQLNKDLTLFARIHSIVRFNIQNKLLPTKNTLFFQSDLFNRVVITESEEKENFIMILKVQCPQPICKRYKKCLCKPKSKICSPRQKYHKVIRRKFFRVSVIVYSKLKRKDFNHFDIQVTLQFIRKKK